MSNVNVVSKDAIFTFAHPAIGIIKIDGFGKDMMMSFTDYDGVSTDIGADGTIIAWSVSAYPEGKFTLFPNSRTLPFLEAIQSLQKDGIVQEGKLTIQYRSTKKTAVLDNVIIRTGLRPDSLEQRLGDREFTFNYTPNRPIQN